MKESTATAVNMMVGISMTTAEPTLVLKKVMVASQPLRKQKMSKHHLTLNDKAHRAQRTHC